MTKKGRWIRKKKDGKALFLVSLVLVGCLGTIACKSEPASSQVTKAPTLAPTPTKKPQEMTPTVTLGVEQPTVTPKLTGSPKLSPTTSEGLLTRIPVPTKAPETTTGVTPTEKPVPTGSPTPAPTPEQTATPSPTPVIEPPLSPTPTEAPAPTELPTPTLEPEPTEAPVATPSPVAEKPVDFEALLQHGFQYTEDFFGEKEIYFSGVFLNAATESGKGMYRCEYRANDSTAVFVLCGREASGLSALMEQLEAQGAEFVFYEQNGIGYRYRTGERLVSGRIYACSNNAVMQIELQSDTEDELQSLVFYVR